MGSAALTMAACRLSFSQVLFLTPLPLSSKRVPFRFHRSWYRGRGTLLWGSLLLALPFASMRRRTAGFWATRSAQPRQLRFIQPVARPTTHLATQVERADADGATIPLPALTPTTI